jgi:hypothetical protein
MNIFAKTIIRNSKEREANIKKRLELQLNWYDNKDKDDM